MGFTRVTRIAVNSLFSIWDLPTLVDQRRFPVASPELPANRQQQMNCD